MKMALYLVHAKGVEKNMMIVMEKDWAKALELELSLGMVTAM